MLQLFPRRMCAALKFPFNSLMLTNFNALLTADWVSTFSRANLTLLLLTAKPKDDSLQQSCSFHGKIITYATQNEIIRNHLFLLFRKRAPSNQQLCMSKQNKILPSSPVFSISIHIIDTQKKKNTTRDALNLKSLSSLMMKRLWESLN